MPEQRSTNGEDRVIVVIGMHRSGTSLITRALQPLGVSLGKNLSVEASPDNAKGHWEDTDVLAFNERLMAALALDWDVIGSADDALMAAPSLEPLVDEARSLISSKLAGQGIWAFKDPRTARLWPFWRRVYAQSARGEPAFVWVVRHPQPVARSLARRDAFGPVKSHLLWLRHNIAPFEDITASTHIVVDYDRFLGQPRVELQRIAKALRLATVDEAGVDEFIDNFLDPDLRHFTWDDDQPSLSGLELIGARAYRALLSIATDTTSPEDPDFQDQWRDICREAALFTDASARIDTSTVAARSLDVVESRLAGEQRRLAEQQRMQQSDQATKLQHQVAETLQEQFAKVSDRIVDAETRLADTHQQRQEEHAVALQRELEAGLQAQFDESVRRLAELQDQIAATMREQAMETGRRIHRVQEELQGVQTELQPLQVESQRVQIVLQDIQTQLQRLQTELQPLQVESQRTGAVLQGVQTELARLQVDSQRFQAELQRIEADTARARADLAVANQLLNQERYTIVKPLLRKAWRLGVRTAEILPAPVEGGLRRVKRTLTSRSVPLTVTIDTPPEHTEPVTPEPIAPDPEEAGDDTASLAFRDRLPGFFDILVFPVIDWHYRFQRPQQLARQLAMRGHRVFYLSTTFEPSEAPGFTLLEAPEPNVALVRLALPGPHPGIYQDQMAATQREQMSAAISRLMDEARLDNLVAIVDLPFWRPLVETVPGCLVVYDCMDYHPGFSTNSPGMIEEESCLLERADLVVTTSAPLSEIVAETAPNLLIRNAGEIDYFSRKPAVSAYSSKRPVAGYLGAIADWFDIELVEASARRFPDWDFVLVGSTDHCDTSQARQLPNIKFIGEVPYADAAAWVHSFDVAMIPFLSTELTRCTNPVKVYEYLAAGKPVVATALPEVQLMSEVVHVADSHDGFMDRLEAAMAERHDTALADRRKLAARPHDWINRSERLDRAIRSAFPKVSVIVLTYNNLEFTKACLKSLEVNTCYPDWELVLVDNASTDGSREFLADYAADKSWVRLVQNEENLGFAAGNNRGLEAATGEYLVVLNNDTYVTRGWLLALVRHLRKDDRLGLVGAVTNNIGNEAKIDIHYQDMAEMQEAAYAYTSRHARETLDVSVVAFFCTAMPRTVYESVGGLDEQFGLGFFEDDDYCRRVAAEGYRIAVADDAFVHHHLSATFDRIDAERRQALFERNKALFEKKWGTWTPHRYRDQ